MTAGISVAARAGERPDVIAALLDEAERAERLGQHELARRRYESALYLLRTPADAARSSTILRRIGRLYIDEGDLAAGFDCLTAALAIAEALDDSSAIAHATNIMAVSYSQRGMLEEAERLWHIAGRMARKAADVKLVAMVEQNLGILANTRGDLPRALAHYQASLGGFAQLRLDENMAHLLNNIGMTYADLAQWEQAERTFNEALTMCAAAGDVAHELIIEVNLAELLIARGEPFEAQVVCERILRRARPLNNVRVLAEVYKHSGVIARELGRPEEAEEFLRLAFESAMSREDLLLAAETAREQAELYTELRRNRETLMALSTSHRLFTSLRAQRDLADVNKRLRRLEQRFHDLVRQWGESIESKDRYTLGHCERVADYACAIANAMGFDETTLFWFRIGALLHDVGKIVVPSDILNKTSPLSPAERQIMQRHAAAGADLLRDIEFPWDVLPMIRSHHERWDGAGYPDGLAGDQIPLSARILCVADVFDALTTNRPYRAAFSRDDALVAMRADAGRAFDPDVLARFVGVARDLSLADGAAAGTVVPSHADDDVLALEAYLATRSRTDRAPLGSVA